MHFELYHYVVRTISPQEVIIHPCQIHIVAVKLIHSPFELINVSSLTLPYSEQIELSSGSSHKNDRNPCVCTL